MSKLIIILKQIFSNRNWDYIIIYNKNNVINFLWYNSYLSTTNKFVLPLIINTYIYYIYYIQIIIIYN